MLLWMSAVHCGEKDAQDVERVFGIYCNVWQRVPLCCRVLECMGTRRTVTMHFEPGVLPIVIRSPLLRGYRPPLPPTPVPEPTPWAWPTLPTFRVWRSGAGGLAVCCSVLRCVAECCSGWALGALRRKICQKWSFWGLLLEVGCFGFQDCNELQNAAT